MNKGTQILVMEKTIIAEAVLNQALFIAKLHKEDSEIVDAIETMLMEINHIALRIDPDNKRLTK